MKTEYDILQEVSIKLNEVGIAYMLTGSIAMNYYAIPRMTRDIDIVIEIAQKDIPSIVKLFQDNYYIDSETIQLAIEYEKLFNIVHNETSIKVDFIIRKKQLYRMQEFNRRKKIEIESFETYIVSKEDLILSKLLWSKNSKSELQSRDIRNLLNTGYDKEYLKINAEELEVLNWLKEIQNG